jgi:hypothetical protein
MSDLVERLRREAFSVPTGELRQERAEAADRIEALESALGPLCAAACGLTHGTDWNKGTHAKLYRQKLIDALQLASATLNRSHGDDYCGIVVVPEGDDNG